MSQDDSQTTSEVSFRGKSVYLLVSIGVLLLDQFSKVLVEAGRGSWVITVCDTLRAAS